MQKDGVKKGTTKLLTRDSRKSEYDPDKTVIISNISDDRFSKNTTDLRRELSTIFGKVNIDICFPTHKGATATYQFVTVEEADRVINNWKSDYFGGSTTIRKPKKGGNYGVIKDVAYDISDEDILNEIKEQYPSVIICKRIIRRDHPLKTIRIKFDNPEDLQKAIANTVILGNCRHQVEESYNNYISVR